MNFSTVALALFSLAASADAFTGTPLRAASGSVGSSALKMSIEKYGDELRATAKQLVRPGYGLLARYESTGTVGTRLESIGLKNTEANRAEWREQLFTTKGLAFPKAEKIREELKNALRSTPKGLEAPKYSIVRVLDGAVKLGVPEKIEIRQYAAFTVATTPSMGGAGFTTLASYLFGGNEEEEAMAMTMPVFTTKTAGNDSGEMQFFLPSAVSAAPPTPLSDAAVNIERVPARLVAVKPFPGLVTDEEVARQETALRAVLTDADLNVSDNGGVSVLQYNGPLTIFFSPWRNRNEIAVVLGESGEDSGAAEKEARATWKARAAATSWYDAGVRL